MYIYEIVMGENNYSELLDLVIYADFHLEKKVVQFLFDLPQIVPSVFCLGLGFSSTHVPFVHN